MSNEITNPYQYFPDFTRGRPIFNGKIYIGAPDTDPTIGGNQLVVLARQEDGTEIGISQPIRTGAGGIPSLNGSPVTLLIAELEFSVRIDNAQDVQQYEQARAVASDNLLRSDLASTDSGKGFSLVAITKTAAEIAVGAIIVKAHYYPGDPLRYGADQTGVLDSSVAIQTAIDVMKQRGGGEAIVPVGEYSIGATTITVPGSVWLIGEGRTAGTRGGGVTNHPVTFRYSGTGTAVKYGGNYRTPRILGISVVAEPGDANYQNFVAFDINGCAYGGMDGCYAEGAARGFYFTATDDDIVHSRFENLSAHACLTTGLETEINAANFMQACHVSVRDITACGTGVRLGGGQQNHNRLESVAGEIGNNTSGGIHLDGDGNTVWQLDGQCWFEGNVGGNIIADSGTLYLSGDVTGQDDNVSGGIIYNGGRVISLGRSSFDDYSIPFTGFTKNGLVMAFSFADEGGSDFHDVISGAKAEMSGAATKVSANTRFGDGVLAVSGASDGLRVRDESFDWTADWTIAALVFNPVTGLERLIKVQKTAGPSFFTFDVARSFVTVRTRDNGGAVTDDNLTMTNDNAAKAPFWVVLSYTASSTTFSCHAPNGEIRESVVQVMPPALSSGGYENFSLTGSLSPSDLTLDELLMYDRLLLPDEIMAIYELQTNVEGAVGISVKGGINRSGKASDTTDGNGEITIAHGLLDVPNFVSVGAEGDNAYIAKVVSVDVTNITVLVQNASGADVATTAVVVYWRVQI